MIGQKPSSSRDVERGIRSPRGGGPRRVVPLLSLLLALASWPILPAWAAPANSIPREAVQPDGTRIQLVGRGDEFLSWTETPTGYSVVRNPGTGFWEYARREIEALELFPSGTVADPDKAPPPGLRAHLKPLRYGSQNRPGGGPANPLPLEERLPDGRILRLVQRGDENLHWWETLEGYSVVKNPRTGRWEYAVRRPVYVLVPSGVVYRPSEPAPEGWPLHLKPSPRPPL